jgi:hypothetical protein
MAMASSTTMHTKTRTAGIEIPRAMPRIAPVLRPSDVPIYAATNTIAV